MTLLVFRILLIPVQIPTAPDLDLRREHNWLQQNYRVEVPQPGKRGDPLSADDVLEYVIGRKFDIIHIAGHGTPDGIPMHQSAQGRLAMLSADDLTRMGRSTEAQLMYINTCSSAKLGQYIVDNNSVPLVIASTYEIGDTQAWSCALSFYAALNETGDFLRAYQIAKPGDGILSLFSHENYVTRSIKPVVDQLELMRTQQRELTRTIEELVANRAERDQSVDRQLKSLTEEVRVIDALVEEIRVIDAAYRRIDDALAALSDDPWQRKRPEPRGSPAMVMALIALMILITILTVLAINSVLP